jgi:hypothetical protein
MANFKVHVTTAAVISLVASLAIYSSGLVSIEQTLFLALIGTGGGILPDIDSDNSKSIKIIFSFLGVCSSLMLLFLSLPSLGILLALFNAAATYFFITTTIKKIFCKYSVHRGVIHSVPIGLLISLSIIVCGILITGNILISWICGIFLLLGFMIHLVLDEICSVDLAGIRLKKSFGTALKLFSKKNIIVYIFVYILLIFLCYYLKGNIPLTFMDEPILSVLWGNFLYELLPHDFSTARHTIVALNTI